MIVDKSDQMIVGLSDQMIVDNFLLHKHIVENSRATLNRKIT